MNVRTAIVLATSIVLFAFSRFALAGDEKSALKPQTACPVMGGKINREMFADYNGWRVYFCCANCVAAFKKDPAKYIDKLRNGGIQLEQTPQTVCPVSGEKLENKDISLEYDGRTIYFCCPACTEAFQKDPAKYLGNLGISIDKEQEKTGEADKPEAHEEHKH